MVRIVFCVLLLLTVALGSTALDAQQLDTEKFYGQGVHHFFNDKHQDAIAKFDEAIKSGTDDPRVYYFRGLANAALKNNDAANADFVKGAELEQARINMRSVVNDSLQRVQGKIRIALETARKEKLKQLEEMRIKNMRVRVSSPFHSPQLNGHSKSEGNPNLPDSSKIKDPTSPFPNLTIRPLQKTTEEKKATVDVFGRKDPMKRNTTSSEVKPATKKAADAPAKSTVKPAAKKETVKPAKKSNNPFDQ